MYAQLLSLVQLFVTPLTVALQAPLSMEFSRQGYWSGLPFPAPGDLPEGSNPSFLYLLYWQADSLPLVPPVEEKIISTYALIQPEATSFVLYTQLFSAVLQHWLKWKL